MINLIMTLIVAILGGTIALRLKIPAGAMVGSMVVVAVFSVITGHAFIPQNIKIITQICAGAYIGDSIKRKDVLEMKLIIKPAILMVVSMITLDLFMGYVMFRVTRIDLITALFSTAPAGIVDMSLISDDFGADTSKVVVLHLIRLVTVLIVFPPMMNFIAKSFKNEDKNALDEIASSVDEANLQRKSNRAKNKSTLKEKSINLLITTVLALATGLIGYILKIPAGTMTFSMAAVGALNVIFDKGFMPLNLRRLTQMFAGALIGSRVTYGDIVQLKSILIPAFILLIGIISVNLFIGFLINKTSGLELITSLLASAPGGLSDMALIAKDLGGDAPKIAILHTVRVVTVIGIFPVLIKIVTS
ncbi:AbrB family transcriptional regulator [Clostridium sp. JS66]|uniref:AbrB family transcriptional regulator n=1 Tax=Clostridium sp. JS66 TaxID=3064705 RepID=UPI00298E69D5|nr:AbrB family transcriptional regulator [Clostridium sp. JS66]WPC41241.1 AbrB family transcriptional regulator [Clostridium sp. JS66]